MGGLRPVDTKNVHTGAQVSREVRFLDHRHDLGLDGFLSVEGVKYTACRLVAEQAVDWVVQQFDRSFDLCKTAETPLCSPVFPDGGSLADQVRQAIDREWACRLSDVILRRMDLGVLGPASEEEVEVVVSVMKQAFGWSEAREKEEMSLLGNCYPLP